MLNIGRLDAVRYRVIASCPMKSSARWTSHDSKLKCASVHVVHYTSAKNLSHKHSKVEGNVINRGPRTLALYLAATGDRDARARRGELKPQSLYPSLTLLVPTGVPNSYPFSWGSLPVFRYIDSRVRRSLVRPLRIRQGTDKDVAMMNSRFVQVCLLGDRSGGQCGYWEL